MAIDDKPAAGATDENPRAPAERDVEIYPEVRASFEVDYMTGDVRPSQARGATAARGNN